MLLRALVVAVTGMGGGGKSILSVRILQTGQETLTVWIDGRTCYRSPKGFLMRCQTVSTIDRRSRAPSAAHHRDRQLSS